MDCQKKPEHHLRIDKFIWSVRLTKTRSLATDLVARKKVLLNNQVVKPSKELHVGDSIQLQKANSWFSYQVLELIDKRIGAPLVSQFIADKTPIEEKEKYAAYLKAQQEYKQYGSGKPTKKNRRDINQYLADSFENQKDF